jgi:heme-degrading monooxygenase HmoA
MLCAHTVRRLKPGTFEQFKEGFGPPNDAEQQGWVRFHMLRNVTDENEVVTFGFFDGTLDQLNSSQSQHQYDARVQDIAPLVESVVSNGVYEIVVTKSTEGAAA